VFQYARSVTLRRARRAIVLVEVFVEIRMCLGKVLARELGPLSFELHVRSDAFVLPQRSRDVFKVERVTRLYGVLEHLTLPITLRGLLSWIEGDLWTGYMRKAAQGIADYNQGHLSSAQYE